MSRAYFSYVSASWEWEPPWMKRHSVSISVRAWRLPGDARWKLLRETCIPLTMIFRKQNVMWRLLGKRLRIIGWGDCGRKLRRIVEADGWYQNEIILKSLKVYKKRSTNHIWWLLKAWEFCRNISFLICVYVCLLGNILWNDFVLSMQVF